jgi:protein-S-isoprenylcysteine O-methyltransferase Ste14
MMPRSAYTQSAIFLVLAAAALFGSAGTFALPGFWIYLAILAAVTVASLATLDPDLIRERMRPGGKRPPLGLRLVGIIPFLHWIAAGLDCGRLHWTDSVPVWFQAAGLAATACGFGLFFWAMTVNPFFSSVARIQAERGQSVVTKGPYGFVRHPVYAAAFLLILGSGVALDSWLAEAMLAVVGIPLLVYRLVTEDRLLKRELPGYRDYASRVRWRVVPGLW